MVLGQVGSCVEKDEVGSISHTIQISSISISSFYMVINVILKRIMTKKRERNQKGNS